MFWGLIMEPGRRYTQEVKRAFHVSMATLDVSHSSNDVVQVMLCYEGRTFLLCTLRKPDLLQCSLDLEFKAGSQISFATNGNGHVHLTGYLTDEFDLDEDEEGDEEEVDEYMATLDLLTKGKKRTAKPLENGKPSKKSKALKNAEEDLDETSDDDDDDDSDEDSDVGVEETEFDSEEDTEVEEEEEENAEEEADEEEDGDVEDREEEEDEEASSLSEEEEAQKPSKKAKTNGVIKADKPDKKNQADKQQQQQQQQQKKAGKQVLQGGLIIEDLQEGQGQAAKKGKFVNVYYEGRLKSNNKVFDALKKGAGFNFRLGSGEVIKGWDLGIVGMRPGGKRIITCPPHMAYGPKGSPPAIPPNATLVFEVVMKKIR